MSSRKAATAKTVRRAKPAARTRVPAVVAAKAAPTQVPTQVAAAEQLAAAIQRALATGDHDVLTPEALQKLMTAACRLYSAQSEAGSQMLPVGEVTPTDIMITASGLMKAGNLAVFELGMWQSWTGR
jgi:uncharacterized heparinase superfamily protein